MYEIIFFSYVSKLLINFEISIAFTITMYEYLATIPTLWKHVMGSLFFSPLKVNFLLTYSFYISDFAHDHPEFIDKDNALGFMSSDNGDHYNLCHC